MTGGKLMLRPEVRWLQTGEGCVIAGDAGLATIRGDRVADLLDRLQPALDGSCDLDQLTRGMAAERAAAVRSLVNGLIARGHVSDGSDGSVTAVALRGTGPIVDALSTALRAARITVVAEGGSEPLIVVHDQLAPVFEPIGRAPFVELLPLNGRLWIGGRSYGVELADVWLRARDRSKPTTATPSQTMIIIAAAQVVYRFTAGIRTREDRDARAVCWHDSTTVTRHRVLTHPSRTAAAERSVADPIRAVASAAALTADEFSTLAARLADDEVGPIGSFEEGDCCQVPLPVSRTVVSDPFGRAGGPAVVHGVGWDFTQARIDCALNGLARYAARCVSSGRALHGRRLAPTGDHLGEHRPGLLVGTDDPSGVAAGLDWPQALNQAAAGLLRQQAIAQLATGGGFLSPLDLDDVSDQRVSYTRRMLEATGGLPELFAWNTSGVDGCGRVPTVIASVDDVPIAVSVEDSPLAALRTALRDCLLGRQATADQSGTYTAPFVGGLASIATIPRTIPTAVSEERVDLATLLARSGSYIVVALDQDLQLSRSLPFLIKVVRDD